MTRRIAIGLLVLFCLFCSAGLFFTVNVTKSFPLGVYRNSQKTPGVGDLVLFCPPNDSISHMAFERGYISAGFCPGGYGFLIKRVLAAKNDTVDFYPEAIFVNNYKIPHSAQRVKDSLGRNLPAMTGRYILTSNQLLLLSDYTPDSFDARYFGFVDKSQVRHVITPFLTW